MPLENHINLTKSIKAR